MMGGAIWFFLSMCLTSCEDILGHWEKPAPATPAVPETVVEEAKVLGAALEEGATVTVKYTVAGNTFTATFKKNGDNYDLVSNTAGSRALTRAASYTPSLSKTADGLKLFLKVIEDGTTTAVLEAYMDIKSGEIWVFQAAAGGFDVSAFKIDDEQPTITNQYNKQVTIQVAATIYAYVNYKEGETWKDVYDRYKDFSHNELTITEDGYLSVTKDANTLYGVYNESAPFTYVKSTDLVGKNGVADCATYYTTQTAPNTPETSAASVATAPTATTGIIEGQTTALVTAGVADGGTMMYQATTTNTKPTSTTGFSATVPTAEGRAAGTYYVWYYAKADATHVDSEISATGIAVTITAKPSATVTTVPTATTGTITAGSTTALVTAGVADGGTMMYEVTTTNTKPTSTTGFSATVPTAEGRAAATYYVWYYAKADATHVDSEISASAVAVTVAAAGPLTKLDNYNWHDFDDPDEE